MSLKTLFLIILLTVFTGGLVYLAILPVKQAAPVQKELIKITPTQSPVRTTLAMSFDQNRATPTALRRKPIAILIDTNNAPVTSAQIELSYDPKILTNVKISQGSFFDVASTGATLNIVDTKLGRISYALSEPENRIVQGKGIIATLAYDLSPLALVSTQSATTISFTSKTSVIGPSTNSSILKSAPAFDVNFKNSLK